MENVTHIQTSITLHTPNGDVPTLLDMTHAEEADTLQLHLRYEGTSYQTSAVSAGRIEHAFAALQRPLPADVYLQCCLTCQHGNFCPVGSDFNEIFCTKDLKISKKADLFFPTEDADERSRRQRAYCDCCPSFAPQVPDVFTYNDYLNALHP